MHISQYDAISVVLIISMLFFEKIVHLMIDSCCYTYLLIAYEINLWYYAVIWINTSRRFCCLYRNFHLPLQEIKESTYVCGPAKPQPTNYQLAKQTGIRTKVTQTSKKKDKEKKRRVRLDSTSTSRRRSYNIRLPLLVWPVHNIHVP